MPLQEQTIHYKTFLLESLEQSLNATFVQHPDMLIREHLTAGVDYEEDQAAYPIILVRFYERDIRWAGVGHKEWISMDPDNSDVLSPFRHAHYHGDVEFAIYAETSYDRALVSDALVQIILMGDTEAYTQAFLDRIYADEDDHPDAAWHFINLGIDSISGFGEGQVKPPWAPEDRLYYTISYRVPLFGEFYSRVPEVGTGLVTDVRVYPYISAIGEDEPEPEPNLVWYGEGDQFF